MDSVDWRHLIEAIDDTAYKTSAHTYIDGWDTNSKPRRVACHDGKDYVIKGRQIGRGIINEHVVGRLGMVLNAPVPAVALVHIIQGLIDEEPEMQHIPVGMAHGTLFIPGCTDREAIKYADVYDNRERFARLAVLYGWIPSTDDPQFIYNKATPQLVYSVDHERFFPNGPHWKLENLTQAPCAVLDVSIQFDCQIIQSEIDAALSDLAGVTDNVIAEVVASVPAQWNIDADERVALAMYLARRRDNLLVAGNLACRRRTDV